MSTVKQAETFVPQPPELGITDTDRRPLLEFYPETKSTTTNKRQTLMIAGQSTISNGNTLHLLSGAPDCRLLMKCIIWTPIKNRADEKENHESQIRGDFRRKSSRSDGTRLL